MRRRVRELEQEVRELHEEIIKLRCMTSDVKLKLENVNYDLDRRLVDHGRAIRRVVDDWIKKRLQSMEIDFTITAPWEDVDE